MTDLGSVSGVASGPDRVAGEIEISRMIRQALERRIDNLEDLNAELAAWQIATNVDHRQVDWHFTLSSSFPTLII